MKPNRSGCLIRKSLVMPWTVAFILNASLTAWPIAPLWVCLTFLLSFAYAFCPSWMPFPNPARATQLKFQKTPNSSISHLTQFWVPEPEVPPPQKSLAQCQVRKLQRARRAWVPVLKGWGRGRTARQLFLSDPEPSDFSSKSCLGQGVKWCWQKWDWRKR